MRAKEIPEKMAESARQGSHMPVVGPEEWADIAGHAVAHERRNWKAKALVQTGRVASNGGHGVKVAAQYMRANPWKTAALGLVATAATVGGMLLRQRSGRRRWW